MPNRYVFSDEAGCFTFKKQKGASKYFMLCTLTTDDCSMSQSLLHIRRDLCLAGEDCDKLHATTDSVATRDAVFAEMAKYDFRVDVTLLEKTKAQPQTRVTDAVFYRYAWFYHFKHVAPLIAKGADKMLVTAAALGQRRTRAAFKNAVNNTIQQVGAHRTDWTCSFMDSAKDPMLWAADYCAWTIQRKWELGDDKPFQNIAKKVASEYDLWKIGSTHHY